jgi:hypothetical protein
VTLGSRTQPTQHNGQHPIPCPLDGPVVPAPRHTVTLDSRADQAAVTMEGVIRTARALGIPVAPGGVAMAVYTLAAVHAVGGDRALALALLRDAIAGDPLLVPKAAREPDFDSLRTDPGFPVPAPT